MYHAICAPGMQALAGQRAFLLNELETDERTHANPDSRRVLRQLVERFNARAGTCGQPELRIALPGMSRSEPTPRPAAAAAAAEQRDDGMLGALQQLWATYRTAYFNGKLPEVDIVLVEPGGTSLGRFDSAGRRVLLHPGLFSGDVRTCQGGTRDQEGLTRFAADILLHEAVHANEYAIGRCSGHEGAFHAQCHVITEKLNPRRKTALQRLTRDNCKWWPDMVRPRSFYKGAVTDLCRG